MLMRANSSAIAEVAQMISVLFMIFDRLRGGYPSPEARGKARVDESGEFLPLGIKGLEMPRGHSRVLGRIDNSTILQDNFIQLIQQAQDLFSQVWQVQSQRHSLARERHQAGRGPFPEGFHDRQE